MDELPPIDPPLAALLERAREAAQHAYAPYSSFRVGAALLLNNGEIASGCNVENSSYGLTLCAERSALVAAVSRYGPSIRIQAVAIANLNRQPSSPCGACRQMLAEFTDPAAPIAFPAHEGTQVRRFEDLLPEVFGLFLDRPSNDRPSN